MGIPNSIRILYKTSHWIMGFLEFYALPHCIPFGFFKYLTNPRYTISNWPILSTPTLPIPSNFLLQRQQVKYSQTLINHNPHLTPMVECKQKFSIMWYLNVLPLSTYCHPQYTNTNWGEQVAATYCTLQYYSCDDKNLNYGWMDWKLTIWKHKLCMSPTQKSNRRVINLCSTFLLQYTTHIAVVFTYFYHIISIPQF
jgi:hypothetical protein